MSVQLLINLPPDCLDIVLAYADDNHPKASVATQSLSKLGHELLFDAVRYSSNNAQRALSGFRRDLVKAVQVLGKEALAIDKAIKEEAIPKLKKLSDKYSVKKLKEEMPQWKFNFLFGVCFKLPLIHRIIRSFPTYLNKKSAIQSEVIDQLGKILPSKPAKPIEKAMLDAMRCTLIRERGAVSRVLPFVSVLSTKVKIYRSDAPICESILWGEDISTFSENDQNMIYTFITFMRQINTKEDLETVISLALAATNDKLKSRMLCCILNRLIERKLSHEGDLEVAERVIMKILDTFPSERDIPLSHPRGSVLTIDILSHMFNALKERNFASHRDLEIAKRLVLNSKIEKKGYNMLGDIVLEFLTGRDLSYPGDLEMAKEIIINYPENEKNARWKILLDVFTERQLSNPGDLQTAKEIAFQMKNRTFDIGPGTLEYRHKDDGIVSILNSLRKRGLNPNELSEAKELINAISVPIVQENQRKLMGIK